MTINDESTANPVSTHPNVGRHGEAASTHRLALLERIAIALQTIARVGRPEDLAGRSGNGSVAAGSCQHAGHAGSVGGSEQGAGGTASSVVTDFRAELAGELIEIKAMLKRQARLAEPSTRKHFSVEEAAEITGYSPWTIRRACATGRLRAEKSPDGRWRIPHDQVTAIEDRGLPK